MLSHDTSNVYTYPALKIQYNNSNSDTCISDPASLCIDHRKIQCRVQQCDALWLS